MLKQLFNNNFNYKLELFTDKEACVADCSIKEIGENHILLNCISIEKSKDKNGKTIEEKFKFLCKISETDSTPIPLNNSVKEAPNTPDKKEE